ncbi:MAG: hypothetical protein OJF47_001135 [Nitrospira sp.]|nr:MAG: hypothetical protein OJF47_001135 [Nitrospira sp.]
MKLFRPFHLNVLFDRRDKQVSVLFERTTGTFQYFSEEFHDQWDRESMADQH